MRHLLHPGLGLLWGLDYALLLWLAIPTGLFPFLQDTAHTGMLDIARTQFPELVAYILCFGLPLGLLLGLWEKPLRIMVATSVLPKVAALAGGSSPIFGFVVHLVISSLIGMNYGLLFGHESSSVGASLAWGTLHGLAWWFIGPLTLMPILLGGSVTRTIQAADLLLPSLLGHLLYGAATGLVFLWFERRNNKWQLLDQRIAIREQRLRRLSERLHRHSGYSFWD